MILTVTEIRTLGCLVEKHRTTPEHYPLTTNALVAACNQKTNRDPVLDLDARTVTEAMLSLRAEGLARTVTGSGRAEKHRHVLDEALGLDAEGQAVFAVLLLRGPQTPGELRTRTERYVGFESVDAVERVLGALADRPEPLVANLGRGPGQSQDRWTHLLGDPAEIPPASPTVDEGPPRGASLTRRVDELEARLAAIEGALGIEPPP